MRQENKNKRLKMNKGGVKEKWEEEKRRSEHYNYMIFVILNCANHMDYTIGNNAIYRLHCWKQHDLRGYVVLNSAIQELCSFSK
jgi:hypothetical protein